MILSIACAVLFLASCSKDDDSAPQDPENQAPSSFALSSPINTTTEVDIADLALNWQTATDPEEDPVSYQVFFGTDTPPTTSMVSGLNTTDYTLPALDFNTTYYWSVTAKDNQGNETSSDVFSFTTRKGTNQELIVGKWILDEIVGASPITNCQKQTYFKFESDGSYVTMVYDNDPCELVNNQIGQYSIEGSILYSTPNGGTQSNVLIELLTETELHLNGGSQVNFVKAQDD